MLARVVRAEGTSMARTDSSNAAEQARLLRGLAFRIHRKRPPEEALDELLGEESRGGRHRQFRAAIDALAEDGFLAAMQSLGWVGDEAAAVLAAVLDANDHRLLSAALGRHADHAERR